jgi:hypothetical protein
MAGALSALEAIGTGFGQGAQAIQEEQRTAAQLALQKVALQQAQSRQQSMAAMLPGLVAAYGQGQPQPKMPPGPPAGFTGPGYTAPPPMGAPTALGPPAASPAGGAGVPVPPSLVPVYAPESGFNPTAQNPTSTASGLGQDINATWRETTQDPRWQAAMRGLGFDDTDYPTAKSAPPSIQNAANIWIQAKYGNKRWEATASARPGTGMTSAGQSAVRGFSPELVAQGRQAATTAAQDFDPMEYGRVNMQRAVEAIDAQDIPPEAKSMAIVQMAQIIQPQDRMMLSMYMQQNRDLIAQARIDQGQARIDQAANKGQIFQQKDGTFVEVTPGGVKPIQGLQPGAAKVGSSAAAALPPEVKYPEKWPGMPEKPPPDTEGQHIREDVWDTALVFARTHQMPALGFQPGMRNQIIQAYPAALHALGIQPSQAPDIAAEYAGERHADIVAGGRAAQIGFGINEALKAAPQVIETAKAVSPTQFPAVNQMKNWLNEQTGDPNIVAFRDALNSYLNVYAATVSRSGRLTDSQQNHAYALLRDAFNQGQIDRGVEQLNYEMELMKSAISPTMEEMGQLGQPPATRKPEAVAPAPGSAQTVSPEQYEKLAPGTAYKIPGSDQVFRKE